MTGFAVQPDPLYTNGQQYDAVRSDLASIYRRLVDVLDAAGTFWGSDEAGQQFAHTYCPAAVGQLQQMNGTGEGLQSIVDGVGAWAKNYLAADDAIAQSTPKPS